MTNKLKLALEALRNGSSRPQVTGEIRTDLLEELRDVLLADGGVGIRGVTVFTDGGRVCVSFRGDDLLNWRQAGALLVMENGLGELTVADTIARALDVTAREVADFLPPGLTAKTTASV